MTKKNPQYWPAFDGAWFDRNQWWIVRLANMPVVGRWLRRKLGLRPDLPLSMLLPMAAHYALSNGQYTTSIYTTWQFSEAMYRAFKPLWWAIHYWDEFIADRWLPEMSYGFDTLTATTTRYGINFDMQIGSDATTYLVARQGANISIFSSDTLTVSQTVSTQPSVYSINRFVCKFDLGGAFGNISPRVTSGTLDLVMQSRSDVSTFQIQVFESTITDNSQFLTVSDWNAFNSQALAARQLSTYAIDALRTYTETAFFQIGISVINACANAYLKLYMRHSQDVSGAIPSVTSFANFYSSHAPSAAPRVTLTYSRLISLSDIDSTITLGSPTITQSAPQIVVQGVDSSIALGSPTITQTNLPIELQSLNASIELGTPTVATVQIEGLDASIALGTLTVATIQFASIDASIQLGTPYVITGNTAIVSMSGIDSTIALGAPTVGGDGWIVRIPGIDNSITLGTPILDTPYPDGMLYGGPYINRIIDQPAEYGYSRYEFEDGTADVNVQPVGNYRWQLEYNGLSAAEVAVLVAHYNGMRGRTASFRFYHRRDGITYRCRYVSMTLPQRERAWSNDVQVMLEALL